jgi:hydrogenase nickel incorporation protein HypB
VITKIDPAQAVGFDWNAATDNIQAARPGMETVRVSSKTGEGMGEFGAALESRLLEMRSGAAT